MIYDPKTGWRETPELIKENSERIMAAQEADDIELIEKMINNARGYLEHLKTVENSIEKRQQLNSFGTYLAKHIGYGAIGNWSGYV